MQKLYTTQDVILKTFMEDFFVKGTTMIASFFCSMVVLALCTSSAFAGVYCSTATVVQSGILPFRANESRSPYVVKLVCKNNAKWNGAVSFFLTSDLGDSGYATILTAQSLGTPLKVKVSDSTPGSLVESIYLKTPVSRP